jgi:hypothetical protein
MGKEKEIRLTNAEAAMIGVFMGAKEEGFKRISAALEKAKKEGQLKPKTPWDSKNRDFPDIPGLVWNAQFDERYLVEVQRPDPKDLSKLKTDAYFGYLLLFDHQKEDGLIFSEVVHFAYGALFGPDIDNVSEWQEKIADFVDNKYQK